MANTYLIVGDDNIEFGTDGAEYTGIGTIVGADREDGGDKLEIKNRKGNVFAVVYFNDQNQCSFDAIFDSSVDIPVRGDAIDLCGLTDVLVDKIKHKWQEGKERMLTIDATRYEALTVG